MLVLSGDQVYRMDYNALLETHHERHAAVTLAVTPVPADQRRRFGMVTFGPDGRVRSLEEKPESTTTPFASIGIYIETMHQANKDPQGFVRFLGEEVDGMISQLCKDMNEQFYGSGTGSKAVVAANATALTITVDRTHNLEGCEGMVFDIVRSGSVITHGENCVLTAINSATSMPIGFY